MKSPIHMKLSTKLCVLAVLSGVFLASCSTVKKTASVAALPVKAVWHTGKGVYLTGKGIYKVGEGVYQIGKVPVKITQAAMRTTSDVLLLTTRVMTTAGTIAETTRKIKRAELEAELAAVRVIKNLVEVIIDVPVS